MNRKQWQKYTNDNIKGGYVAGSNKADFYKNGLSLFHRLESESGILEQATILDIGCANGRLPVVLDGEGVGIESYTGLDVSKPAIDFCTKAFADNPLFTFHHINARNRHYANHQNSRLQSIKFPGSDYSLVVANSLFTHLGNPKNVKHYLKEVSRVLDGNFYSTWFRNPPHPVNHNEAMSVYTETSIRTWFEMAGLEIIKTYGGTKLKRRDHWRIVARTIK